MHHARARQANTCYQVHHYADVGYISRFKIREGSKQTNKRKSGTKEEMFRAISEGEMGRRREEEGGRDRRREGEKGEGKSVSQTPQERNE